MEVCEETEFMKKSFKYKETLYESLKLKYHATKTMFVFWNKYQIFIHEGWNLSSPAKVLTTEFLIHDCLVSQNYLICLDLGGNVHTISLKFKNSAQKRFKSCFQPRLEGVLQFSTNSPESVLSLKTEYKSIFLCQNKINSDFQLEQKVAVIFSEQCPDRKFEQSGCILHVNKVSNESISLLKGILPNNLEETSDYKIVLVTFDKLSIYACMYKQKMAVDAVNLVKLYSSPSEICDFSMLDELKLVIGLSCGTLIILPLKEKAKPEIVHLNTALSKFTMIGTDAIVYTDGISMWKAENIFSKDNSKIYEYFVKDVKDFIVNNDQIICTSYSNVIYVFHISEEPDSNNDKDDYILAERVLSNSECLNKVTQEIEVNKEIINDINLEGNYLTAVALSKRPDIMNKVIEETVILYDSYEEILKHTSDLVLTENLEEYFKPDSIQFLIKITTNVTQHNLSNILRDLFRNVHVHITLLTEEAILKTTTLKLNNTLKKVQIMMPLQKRDLTKVQVEIKLILNIPGTFDKKQEMWTVFHKNTIKLNVEHFIKTGVQTKVCNLKEPENNIEDLIIQAAEKQHGELFKFIDTLKLKAPENETLDFYVKLPENYENIFNTKEKYTCFNLSSEKAEFLQGKLSTPEYLNSRTGITLDIGMKEVILQILNDDFSAPVLKVSSADPKIAAEMRNFLADLFYKDNEKKTGEEFVHSALYTTTENIQRELKVSRTPEEYRALVDKFHRYVVASLPL